MLRVSVLKDFKCIVTAIRQGLGLRVKAQAGFAPINLFSLPLTITEVLRFLSSQSLRG